MKKKFLTSKKTGTIKLSVYFAVLMCLITVITTVVFAGFAVLNIKEIVSKYESNDAKFRTAFSTIFLQTLRLDAQNKDKKHSSQLIDLLKRDNLIAYVQVQDEDGNLIMGGKAENIDISKKIREQTAEIGGYIISIGVPNQNYYSDTMSNLLDILPQAFLILIIAGIIASIFLSDIISKPLERISKAAKQITEGNFNVRIEKSNFSEINDLIYSYNEMSFQLNELYSSLELKVQERTIALEEANYKLKETQAMMVHSEKMRSLGELVAGIAHEINNPVNFIHGNIMILQNYADDLLKLIDLYQENSDVLSPDAKAKIESLRKEIDLDFLRGDIKDLIKSCVEGTQRTKNIVLDLKNFSRMEEMVLTQFDIPKEIDTTLNILNNKYKNRITVVKNYSPDVPKIEAYGGQLNQVFMNILDNAQDAMGESGTLTINTFKEGENVKIEFIDTGKGIPPENLKKVFDPFFTTKPVGKGTGLGMSISYRVIKDHKGRIDVESEVGKGTKFTVILPIAHQDSKSEDEKIIDDLRHENGVV